MIKYMSILSATYVWKMYVLNLRYFADSPLTRSLKFCSASSMHSLQTPLLENPLYTHLKIATGFTQLCMCCVNELF